MPTPGSRSSSSTRTRRSDEVQRQPRHVPGAAGAHLRTRTSRSREDRRSISQSISTAPPPSSSSRSRRTSMRLAPSSPVRARPTRSASTGSGLVCQGLLAAGLCSYTWLTNSTGFQGYKQFYASKRWNLAQHLPKYYGKLQADPNETAADFGAFQVLVGRTCLRCACSRASGSGRCGADAMDGLDARAQGQIHRPGPSRRRSLSKSSSTRITRRLPGYTPPSCAATVCAALQLTGYRSTHNAAAVSYRDYGDPCKLKPGCIVVYQWPNKDHHVDFCDAIIDGDTFAASAATGFELKDSDYSRRYIVATRGRYRRTATSKQALTSEPTF